MSYRRDDAGDAALGAALLLGMGAMWVYDKLTPSDVEKLRKLVPLGAWGFDAGEYVVCNKCSNPYFITHLSEECACGATDYSRD